MSRSGLSVSRETRRLTQQAEGGTATHPSPDRSETDAAAHVTGTYPRANLNSSEAEEDEYYADVAAMTQDGVSRFGRVTADAGQIAAYLERKRQKMELANFDQWVGTNFHKNDPMARKWLQETYPEYYEAREKLAVERAKFALRVFLLKLRGPKNEKDLILLWGLQTGRVRLDDGWDRIGYSFPASETANAQTRQDRFMNHLFGPYKFNTGADRKEYLRTVKDENNPFKAVDKDGNAIEGIGGTQTTDDIFARGLSSGRGIADLFSEM